MTAITYKIGDPAQSYSGSIFGINASSDVQEICGELAVKAQFNGVDISDNSDPLSYDDDNISFTVETSDNQYVLAGNSNPYPYTLNGFLSEYPDEIETELESTVVFEPQCGALVCPNLGIQEYTITSDASSISFSSLI